MPTYDYECSACKNAFSEFAAIKNRDLPLRKRCLLCGAKIQRAWRIAPVGGVDTKLNPGTRFKEIMTKLSASVPERYRENLARAASLRGGKYGAQ